MLNRLTKEAVSEGYNAVQIMSQLHDLVVEDEQISNQQKNAILMYLSLTDKRLNDGADEHLQILDMLTTMRSILSQSS
jgi:replication factor C subunit 2/4